MVDCKALMRLPPSLLALLLALSVLGAADHSETSTVTRAPIYLPYYDNQAWSLVRGSILASNPASNQTTYTIFCPAQTPPACDLSLDFPFVIVEGPRSLHFHGTYTSTYIANLGCILNDTTAATCSGYSSFKSGFSVGPFTGPTQVSWTSTFSGKDVDWGSLTLTSVPTSTNDVLGITATAPSTPAASSTAAHLIPTPTTTGAGTSLLPDMRWVFGSLLSAVMVAGLLA